MARPTRWRSGPAVVAVAYLTLVGFAASASAAGGPPKAPGLLRVTDLPAGLRQTGDPATLATVSVPVLDKATCTETPEPVPNAASARSVQFGPTDASNLTTYITEFVATFTNAVAARTAFATRAATHAGRLRCKTVGFVPANAVGLRYDITYEAVPVNAVGEAAFAVRGTSADIGGDGVAVTFRSGRYLVILGFSGDIAPGTASKLTALSNTASRRLGR
jgi:hypothetical protein